MASIRPRPDMGGKYELSYVDTDGLRYRINTGTRDKKVADAWLAKAEEQISLAKLGVIGRVGRLTRAVVAGEEAPQAAKRLRLAEFAKEYHDRGHHDLELAPKTLGISDCAFASLQSVVGNVHIHALTQEDVRRWKRQLASHGRAKTTISMYQRALRTAFNRAVKWKLAPQNPFTDVEIPSSRSEDGPRKSMDIPEVRALLAVVDDPAFRRYLQFILYTGARRNEILYLKREDLDLAQRILYATVPKTHRRLALPINKALMRVIAEMMENGELPESGYLFRSRSNRVDGRRKDVPWHPSSVTSLFKRYVRRAGLPDHYSVHSCRHTYTTHLRGKGVPQDVIQRLLGHTSSRTTNIYDHSDALFFRQYADQVDFGDTAAE